HHVNMNHDAVEIDCDLFAHYVAHSRQHAHDGATCEACFEALKNAEALYSGEFLADLSQLDSPEFDEWRSLHATIKQREYAGVLRGIAEHYQTQGDAQQAIDYALRWLALDNLHEPAHQMLMRLYAESGQRADAIRQYQECVAILDAELATVPDTETVTLYEHIRDGDIAKRSAIPTSRSAYSVLPAVPPLVVGREETLQEIKQRLGIGGQARANLVIQGLPGVGKSTIMAHLAHDADLNAAFPDGILWTSLGENPDILAKLRTWATALALVETQNVTIEALSVQISAKLKDKRVLLLIDDVWQVEHSKPFRVGGSESTAVFSSRLKDVARALTSTQLDFYNLSVLTSDSAIQLLKMLTPNTVSQFPQESLQLVEDLEGLPLAIQVAGRLLQAEERLGWGVVDLLAELREGANLLYAG
ncbi:MAG: hypothetical protein KC496_20900, partial [Anaerolineae bacterium]|nr:hypothetical protein [Anaerolineae bacterium]